MSKSKKLEHAKGIKNKVQHESTLEFIPADEIEISENIYTKNNKKKLAQIRQLRAIFNRAKGGWPDDVEPLFVVGISPHYSLQDGHHRFQAALESGLEHVLAWVVPLDLWSALVDQGWERTDFSDALRKDKKSDRSEDTMATKKKNPGQLRRRRKIEGAQVGPPERKSGAPVVGESDPHPRYEAGQKRLFPHKAFQESELQRVQPPELPPDTPYRPGRGYGEVRVVKPRSQWQEEQGTPSMYDTSEGQAHDAFVYEPYVPGPWAKRPDSWIDRAREDIEESIRVVTSGRDVVTEVLQVPAFKPDGNAFEARDIEAIESELVALADELKTHATSLSESEEEADRTDFFDESLESYLREVDVTDVGGGGLAQRIQDAIDAGADEDRVREIVCDSSRWQLRPGSDNYADWSDEYDEHEVTRYEDAQDRDTDFTDVRDRVVELFQSVGLVGGIEDLDENSVGSAWLVWLHTVLDVADWTLQHGGEWQTHITIGAHANITDRGRERMIEDLDALIEDVGGEADDEDEDDDTPPEPHERRPYVTPETSQRLDIALPHDYAVYNVSWQEFTRIGEELSICVGTAATYAEAVKKGEIQVWVVRDPNGENLFCIEVTFASAQNAPHTKTCAACGRENSPSDIECRGCHHPTPTHFVQVKGVRNRLPGWSDKDFYAYGSRGEIYTPLRGRAKNPANVDKALTVRELRKAQPVPGAGTPDGGEVHLCRALCEAVGLDPYGQPDLLPGLYAKERFEVFDSTRAPYDAVLANAQGNNVEEILRLLGFPPETVQGARENPSGSVGFGSGRPRRRLAEGQLTPLRWPRGRTFATPFDRRRR